MTLVGNRDRFALGYELVDDPDAGGAPHVRASWGRLEVWVSGRNLTAGRADDGSSVGHAVVPLAPIVQWIAQQWDPMFHEGRFPRPAECATAAAWRMDSLTSLPTDEDVLDRLLDERDGWWHRHGLGACLPEFRVPDLHVRRVNTGVELSWDDREWRSVPGGVRLLESPGAVVLPALEAAGVMHEWALSVVDVLAEVTDAASFAGQMRSLLEANAAPVSPLVRLRWAAGQRLKRAAAELRHLAGVAEAGIEETLQSLLGASPDQGAGLVTPLTVPAMLFKAANPTLSTADVLALVRVSDQPVVEGENLLQRHQRPEPPPTSLEAVTQDGYDKAIAFRCAVGVDVSRPLMDELDLETHVLPNLGVDLVELTLDDYQVDGAAISSPNRRPVIAVNLSGKFSSSRWGRRMTLAHELCHLLHDLSDGRRVGVLSNPWAPYLLERRANAFAAMLLMPEQALAALLPRSSRQWTPQTLEHAMDTLGVGRSALTWHLYNLRWISASERRAWLDAL